ncbi:MAG: cytochrome c oxidase subunit II [Jatrophihabitans sp.]|uniref:aa3-type cytochrome oxidase subunit II n=1 Tax=Jatrophihabitans sp. TaxID=1932789 RepID=UPI00391575BF
MRRRRWARGGRAAVLLGSLTVLLTGCSAADWERNLRFGWPTGVTKEGTQMRVLWTWAGVTALILGVIVWGLIFWCCIRYRKRDEDYLPRQTKYNFAVEAICFIFPFLVIAGLFYRTVIVENNVNNLTKHPDVKVQVDAFKWNWQFEYQGYTDPGGTVHKTVYPGEKALADATGNDLIPNKERNRKPARTCDEASSNESYNCGASGGQDAAAGPLYLSTVGSQQEIPVLVIPVNRRVRFVEHSEDVVHSFWVIDFLFKRDVIPYGTTSTARDNQFEITAFKKGSFVGRCAELCGTYHSQMNFEVRVVSESTFENYLNALQRIGSSDPARQAKALAAAGLKPYATSTYPLTTARNQRKAAEPPRS